MRELRGKGKGITRSAEQMLEAACALLCNLCARGVKLANDPSPYVERAAKEKP